MQLFYEILPVFLFFLAFKFYGIYIATIVGVVATFIQAAINRILFKVWDKKQVITFIVFALFGGLTLYFHDPIFVKWKPTIIFWIFGVIILISQVISKRPLMQRFMEHALKEEKTVIPAQAWRKINLIWAVFFLGLGALNLYIAYHYSSDTWVNFKFYGITAALLLMSIVQAFYLLSFISMSKLKK